MYRHIKGLTRSKRSDLNVSYFFFFLLPILFLAFTTKPLYVPSLMIHIVRVGLFIVVINVIDYQNTSICVTCVVGFDLQYVGPGSYVIYSIQHCYRIAWFTETLRNHTFKSKYVVPV